LPPPLDELESEAVRALSATHISLFALLHTLHGPPLFMPTNLYVSGGVSPFIIFLLVLKGKTALYKDVCPACLCVCIHDFQVADFMKIRRQVTSLKVT
jgi:hypothetical protein